jgi:hypothetical protein
MAIPIGGGGGISALRVEMVITARTRGARVFVKIFVHCIVALISANNFRYQRQPPYKTNELLFSG